MGRWYANEGDVIRANIVSSGAYDVRCFAEVILPNGKFETIRGSAVTTNGTRAEQTFDLTQGIPTCEIVAFNVTTFTANVKRGALFVQAYIVGHPTLCQGYVTDANDLMLGDSVEMDFDRTYVFQGTVGEDATAGTHVSSLTVTPGAGNELEVLYGYIKAGNGAANLTDVVITDGVNTVGQLNTAGESLSANQIKGFPTAAVAAGAGSAAGARYMVSGTMTLKLSISTTTVSLTHTFAVIVRVSGLGNPTFALADSVGTPTLTVNTSAVF